MTVTLSTAGSTNRFVCWHLLGQWKVVLHILITRTSLSARVAVVGTPEAARIPAPLLSLVRSISMIQCQSGIGQFSGFTVLAGTRLRFGTADISLDHFHHSGERHLATRTCALTHDDRTTLYGFRDV